MSGTRKKHLVYAGLLLLTLWPLFHIYLVKRYDVSAWKLAGWGMYTTPRLDFAGMRVFRQRAGSEELEYLESIPVAFQEQARSFLESYRWLRKLVRPDDLAQSILDDNPQFDRVLIVVYQPVMERHTGMIVGTEVVYEYPGPSP